MKNRIITFIVGLVAATALVAGCTTDADTVSRNISQGAEQFEILRRVVLVNGITNEYLLNIEGFCSIEDQWNLGARQLEVTCKIGDDAYEKHFLGISDNVFYFVQQSQTANVSANFHRVIFKPQAILPDIDPEFNDLSAENDLRESVILRSNSIGANK